MIILYASKGVHDTEKVKNLCPIGLNFEFFSKLLSSVYLFIFMSFYRPVGLLRFIQNNNYCLVDLVCHF